MSVPPRDEPSRALPEGPAPPTPRGRPARWADPAARQRDYRLRQAEKLRLLNGLLLAARNARWADSALHRVSQHGEDAELLAALTAHYRRHHWCHVKTTGPDEGGKLPTD